MRPWRNRVRSELQSNLPEVTAGLLQAECVGDVGQRKRSIDYRPDTRRLYGAYKIDLMPAANLDELIDPLMTHDMEEKLAALTS